MQDNETHSCSKIFESKSSLESNSKFIRFKVYQSDLQFAEKVSKFRKQLLIVGLTCFIKAVFFNFRFRLYVSG